MPNRSRATLAWLTVLCLAGCAGPGGKLAIFPEGHGLREDAKLIRDLSELPLGMGRELRKTEAEEYRVEPGDVLLVQPVELASQLRLPGDQPVLPDGTIRLGQQLGPLKVMNLTVGEIQDAVDELARSKGVAERITVRLVTRDSKVFYVLGEVNAPGAFQLRGRETVLDALMAAGGLNSNASKRNILLVRPTPPDSCRIVLGVDYTGIVQLGDTTTNYQIRAGDRVYVPSKCASEGFLDLFGDKKSKCRLAAPPCYPRGNRAPCAE